MTELKKDDRRFIAELLTWDAARRSSEWALANIALLVGCAAIGVAATTIVLSPRAVSAVWVTVPALVAGVVLVGFFLFTHARIRERERFARILRHLGCG